MRVAEYLFERLRAHRVETTFGIPGDYALPLFAAQLSVGMPTVVMTHEPSVGYAADVYGRLRGLGVAVVTYGAGALNMVNAVAMAYAEESPMLVISGAPEVGTRRNDIFFHHRVKNYDSQFRVMQEVTEASAVLRDPWTAAYEIDRVIDCVRTLSRPGYLEIPRDIVNAEIDPNAPKYRPPTPDKSGLDEALDVLVHRLNTARSVVIYAGQEAERFNLTSKLVALVERLNVPVTTSFIGKSVVPENHPNFIGQYVGRVSDSQVRETVESAECIFGLGILLSDMDTGGFSAALPPARLIQATSSSLRISHAQYPNINLRDVIEGLLDRDDLRRHDWLPQPQPDPRPDTVQGELTMDGILAELNGYLRDDHIVVSDVGDPLFGAVALRSGLFIGAGYYASMGLAVPGAIGAALARPDLKPVVMVGDGAFQMDGVEISTAVGLDLNQIVVVINNGTFATLKAFDQDRPYMKVRRWDYAGLARALGAQGERVDRRADFGEALRRAEARGGVYLIDAVVDEDDMSIALRRFGTEIGRNVRTAISAGTG